MSNVDELSQRQLAKEVMSLFFVPVNRPIFFNNLDKIISTIPPSFLQIAEAFRHNLDAAISTVSIPLELAMAMAQEKRFQQISIAWRIRARRDLGPDGEPTAQALHNALDEASKQMTDELQSPEGINTLADDACAFLIRLSKQGTVKQASDELLRQGIVLVWAAFEVLSRDLFVEYLDRKPDCALRIVNDPSTKRLFEFKGLSLDLLAEHEYDLSHSMGKVFSSFHDLANLTAIKNVFNTLFPDNVKLREALDSRELWSLSQRRNLIVHKRAIVDEKYLQNIKGDAPIGSQITIVPDDIENSLELVRGVGKEQLAAVCFGFV